MPGYVTFDTINPVEDQNNIDGCYKIDDENWKVFYFTHCVGGEIWLGEPIITENAIFESGILGIDVILPASTLLNNETVVKMLSEILKVEDWTVVLGPDSLQLK